MNSGNGDDERVVEQEQKVESLPAAVIPSKTPTNEINREMQNPGNEKRDGRENLHAKSDSKNTNLAHPILHRSQKVRREDSNVGLVLSQDDLNSQALNTQPPPSFSDLAGDETEDNASRERDKSGTPTDNTSSSSSTNSNSKRRVCNDSTSRESSTSLISPPKPQQCLEHMKTEEGSAAAGCSPSSTTTQPGYHTPRPTSKDRTAPPSTVFERGDKFCSNSRSISTASSSSTSNSTGSSGSRKRPRTSGMGSWDQGRRSNAALFTPPAPPALDVTSTSGLSSQKKIKTKAGCSSSSSSMNTHNAVRKSTSPLNKNGNALQQSRRSVDENTNVYSSSFGRELGSSSKAEKRYTKRTTAGGKKPNESKSYRRIIVASGVSKPQYQRLKRLCKSLGGLLCRKFAPQVTHLITGTEDDFDDKTGKICPLSKRTMKYMYAIVGAKWIVSFQWAERCLSEQRWVDEEQFEISGDTSHNITYAPRRARLARAHSTNTSPAPKLFEGLSFHLLDSYPPNLPSREVLYELIVQGGGKVLLSNEHKKGVLVCSPDVTQEEAEAIFQERGLEALSLMWVLDCISLYNSMPMDSFKPRLGTASLDSSFLSAAT